MLVFVTERFDYLHIQSLKWDVFKKKWILSPVFSLLQTSPATAGLGALAPHFQLHFQDFPLRVISARQQVAGIFPALSTAGDDEGTRASFARRSGVQFPLVRYAESPELSFHCKAVSMHLENRVPNQALESERSFRC